MKLSDRIYFAMLIGLGLGCAILFIGVAIFAHITHAPAWVPIVYIGATFCALGLAWCGWSMRRIEQRPRPVRRRGVVSLGRSHDERFALDA